MRIALPEDQALAVVPRSASTTLVLRDGPPGLEVLMVRRSPNASFMPDAYVFPGGALDAADGAPETIAACDEPAEALHLRIGDVTGVGARGLAHAVAALRECFEECGLWLGAKADDGSADARAALRARLHRGEPFASLAAEAALRLATSALVPWSRWVTPVGVPKRFDTVFFVTTAPQGQTPEVDAGETTTLAWVHPPDALAARERGEFQMEFATVRTVESLLAFAGSGVDALMRHAGAVASLPTNHPRLRIDSERRILGVMLPGEPGYDEAPLRHRDGEAGGPLR